LGQSRGGFSTKIHIVTEGQGIPLVFTLTPGQRHDSTEFANVVNAVPLGPGAGVAGPHEDWPDALAGDKGYSSGDIRAFLESRRIEDVIPTKINEERREGFDKDKYRQRNVVERCIGWLKECRRIATRYDKLAVRYGAMVTLGIIMTYVKLLT
jgi:transposase